jgi:hypothetical protein
MLEVNGRAYISRAKNTKTTDNTRFNKLRESAHYEETKTSNYNGKKFWDNDEFISNIFDKLLLMNSFF